jgi:dTDP-4-dehydrorhamnose reductase
MSTDYVFSGSQAHPYKESDLPAPLNIHGHSKLAGENFALGTVAGGYVLRVGALYSVHPCRGKAGKNFICTMLEACAKRSEVAVVDDELITPTCTADVAQQLSCIISSDLPPGVYHATAQGMCTWFGFAQEIFKALHLATPLRAATPGEFPVKTPRPPMSVLENAALARARLDMMPSWQDALRNFLERNESATIHRRAQAMASAVR